MTGIEKLRAVAEAATFDRVDPSTYLKRKRLAKAWPTESDLDRDGFGVWFGDPRDDAYIAAVAPDVVLRLLNVVEAAEAWADSPHIEGRRFPSEYHLVDAVRAFRGAISPEAPKP